ncbi:tryptophan 7-halogenase [Alteromonas sp. AMM-1]|uniref:tryptophan 7-halogenase n=1 Tax=Alteromonas sp. AMM-1 TaxID=3394233 RepID=UPI0039A7543E
MSGIKHIVIAGNGLAANMTALALQQQLPPDITLTLVSSAKHADLDFLYGSTSVPDMYAFNLTLNVSEPDLLFNTNSTFCWGNYFDRWAMTSCSWLQGFHLPFPAMRGVGLHHFVTRHGETELATYLINAQADKTGKFAHPPEDNRHPLSRAEYGYQFDASALSALYASKLSSKVTVINASISEVVTDTGDISITGLQLTNGQRIEADLYIDCTGPDARLYSALAQNNQAPKSRVENARTLFAIHSTRQRGEALPTHRYIRACEFGWQADTYLRDSIQRLTVCSPEQKSQAIDAHGAQASIAMAFSAGHRQQAWTGNCVAIGQAASVIEPLTPAPLMMLMRDIQRLLELIPITNNMSVEATEYNRRFIADVEHTELFQGALFALEHLPDSLPEHTYWQQAAQFVQIEKLTRKLTQYNHRGILVSYDLEPFNEQEWLMLHSGMQRRPQTYDIVADQVPRAEMANQLNGMGNVIQQVVSQMPPHAIYLEKLMAYLSQKRSQ